VIATKCETCHAQVLLFNNGTCKLQGMHFS
jgi:hypothetical protein